METVRIERFTSRVEADMAAAMLRARGINARVTADDVAGIHPDIPFGIGGTAVEVPREEYDDAVALLDEEFDGQLDVEVDINGGEDAPEHDGEPPSRDSGPPVREDAWDRTGSTGRRPGLRIFAVFAAVVMLAVFVAEVGGQFGWW